MATRKRPRATKKPSTKATKKRPTTAAKNRAVAARALAESTSTHPMKRTRSKAEAAAVDRLRAICLALPGVTEKIAWGEATWRAGKMFAQMDTHHHGAAHVAVWLPARPGAQEELVEEDPEHYFRPPYVGAKGWVGVRIDNDPDWRAVAGLVTEAYREVAPAPLLAKLDAAPARASERGWRASWLDDEPEP
jgi:hypothetical protein